MAAVDEDGLARPILGCNSSTNCNNLVPFWCVLVTPVRSESDRSESDREFVVCVSECEYVCVCLFV